VGAFVGLVAVTTLNLPFVPAIALAAVAAGLLSVALDWLAFRPLRRRAAPEFAALISSIGAGLVITNVAQLLSQTKIWRYPFGTFPIEIFTAFGLRITLLQLTIAGCMIITVAALVFFLFYSSFGRQIRAVAINARTASLLGCNPEVVYFLTFFIS